MLTTTRGRRADVSRLMTPFSSPRRRSRRMVWYFWCFFCWSSTTASSSRFWLGRSEGRNNSTATTTATARSSVIGKVWPPIRDSSCRLIGSHTRWRPHHRWRYNIVDTWCQQRRIVVNGCKAGFVVDVNWHSMWISELVWGRHSLHNDQSTWNHIQNWQNTIIKNDSSACIVQSTTQMYIKIDACYMNGMPTWPQSKVKVTEVPNLWEEPISKSYLVCQYACNQKTNSELWYSKTIFKFCPDRVWNSSSFGIILLYITIKIGWFIFGKPIL